MVAVSRVWVFTGLLSLMQGADSNTRCPPNIARNLYMQTRGGRCYQFISTEKNKKGFDDKKYCAQQGGGALITIEQAGVEQKLINAPWSGSRLWIGATDRNNKQYWKWVPGREMPGVDSNVGEGSPSCSPGSMCRDSCLCLLIVGQNTLLQTFCSADDFQYGFICQYDILQEITTCTISATPPTTTKKYFPLYTNHALHSLKDVWQLLTESRNIGITVVVVLVAVFVILVAVCVCKSCSGRNRGKSNSSTNEDCGESDTLITLDICDEICISGSTSSTGDGQHVTCVAEIDSQGSSDANDVDVTSVFESNMFTGSISMEQHLEDNAIFISLLSRGRRRALSLDGSVTDDTEC